MVFNPLERVNGRPLNILITIASTCGFFLFGYVRVPLPSKQGYSDASKDNGVFSGLIISPWFLKTFHHPNSTLLGTVSATYNLGGFAGSLVAFFIGDNLGRRWTILSGTAITIIGAIPFACATDITQLLAGRIVCGIGVGLMTSTVGLWEAETTPARTRGSYLVAQLIFGAAFGLFLAQWINYSFYNSKGREAFAFPVAFQLVFLVLSGVLVLGLPESPRWLAKKDRNEEALRILERLTGSDAAQQQMNQIRETVALERSVEGNQFTALFTTGPTQNFRRLCLACGVMIMHQLGGINSVRYDNQCCGGDLGQN
jgi:MFS family permease